MTDDISFYKKTIDCMYLIVGDDINRINKKDENSTYDYVYDYNHDEIADYILYKSDPEYVSKYIKESFNINELHYDTYYSASDKWNMRKPGSNIVNKFKQAGNKELYKTYGTTHIQPDIERLRDELDIVFEKCENYERLKTEIAIKNDKLTSMDMCFIIFDINHKNGKISFELYLDGNSFGDSVEKSFDEKYYRLMNDEPFVVAVSPDNTGFDRTTAKKLYNFIKKYKNIFDYDGSDIDWYDLWDDGGTRNQND